MAVHARALRGTGFDADPAPPLWCVAARYNIFDVHGVYDCNQQHPTFKGYYHCHCRYITRWGYRLFYLGTLLLVVTAALLLWQRFSTQYNDRGAGVVFVAVVATCGGALVVLQLMLPASTRRSTLVNSRVRRVGGPGNPRLAALCLVSPGDTVADPSLTVACLDTHTLVQSIQDELTRVMGAGEQGGDARAGAVPSSRLGAKGAGEARGGARTQRSRYDGDAGRPSDFGKGSSSKSKLSYNGTGGAGTRTYSVV